MVCKSVGCSKFTRHCWPQCALLESRCTSFFPRSRDRERELESLLVEGFVWGIPGNWPRLSDEYCGLPYSILGLKHTISAFDISRTHLYIERTIHNMALAMSSTAQQMGSISCQAVKLQRTTFTGTPLALASRTSHRNSLLMKSLTPQAIFSRNKEQQVCCLGLNHLPACGAANA